MKLLCLQFKACSWPPWLSGFPTHSWRGFYPQTKMAVECNPKCTEAWMQKIVIFQLKAIICSCRTIWGTYLYPAMSGCWDLTQSLQNHWNTRQWLNVSPCNLVQRQWFRGNVGFGSMSGPVQASTLPQHTAIFFCTFDTHSVCYVQIYIVWISASLGWGVFLHCTAVSRWFCLPSPANCTATLSCMGKLNGNIIMHYFLGISRLYKRAMRHWELRTVRLKQFMLNQSVK